ncbi:uncharacterized protein LOC115305943 isoform X2 [Suricata suricatta]|uniref:uncharacterized protein LOC115305943 isoform X2 n=1 Tax=Suricata suricatta TaxID=37032 RepID=UPI001156B313|nr:uncharacterized protein LOC115305943 isoform X2 [Suricata suricatta]
MENNRFPCRDTNASRRVLSHVRPSQDHQFSPFSGFSYKGYCFKKTKNAGPLESSVFSWLVSISTHKSLAMVAMVSPLTSSSCEIRPEAVPSEARCKGRCRAEKKDSPGSQPMGAETSCLCAHSSFSHGAKAFQLLADREAPGHLFLIPRTASKSSNRGYSQEVSRLGDLQLRGPGAHEAPGKPKVVSAGLSRWGRAVPRPPPPRLPAGFQKEPGVGTKEAFCLSEFDVCFAFRQGSFFSEASVGQDPSSMGPALKDPRGSGEMKTFLHPRAFFSSPSFTQQLSSLEPRGPLSSPASNQPQLLPLCPLNASPT